MPELPAREDCDFLMLQGATHVVLGAGQRVPQSGFLPRDAGIHLVAGRARRGGFRTIATVPAGEGVVSPDGRWLGVGCGETWVVHDLHNGCAPGFRFERALDPRWEKTLSRHRKVFSEKVDEIALHPSGEMMARKTAERLELWLPDGKLLKSVALPPRHKHFCGYRSLTFSASGEHLWLASAPAEGDHELQLLGVPGLDVLDRIAQPRDSRSEDEAGQPWPEFSMSVSPATDHLAIRRWGGDTFFSLTFHSVRGRKIVTNRHHVGRFDDEFNGDPIGEPAHAPSGKRFCAWDSYCCIYEWRWPSCVVENQTHVSALQTSVVPDFYPETMAYWNDLIFVTSEDGEVQVLQSGTLEDRQTVRPFTRGELLPNGMLVNWREDGQMDVMEFHLHPGRIAVVLEMDSERGCCRRVLHRQQRQWQDVTGEITWIEPNFDFDRDW
jgi:hypothetical protein